MITVNYSPLSHFCNFRDWLFHTWNLMSCPMAVNAKVKDVWLPPASYLFFDHESVTWARAFRLFGVEVCVLLTKEWVWDEVNDCWVNPETKNGQ